MKPNEETTILNDNTRVARDEKTVYQKNEKASLNPDDSATPKNVQPTWKTVTISGVSGIALGAAGVLFTGASLPEKEATNQMANETMEQPEEEVKEEEDAVNAEIQAASGESSTININIEGGEKIESINLQQSEGNNVTVNINLAESPKPASVQDVAAASPTNAIPFATGVNDSMSFGEAFAAARHEVGAGGAFVWHGTVYGTYYANEWSQMSSAEKSQFTADAIRTYHEGDTFHHEANTAVQDNDAHLASNDDSADAIDVHVLGVQQDVAIDNDTVVDMGFAYIDGHAAMLIDIDQDGGFDAAAIDLNDNGQIDEGEYGLLNPELGLTVEDFIQASDANSPIDDMYANTPDYTNDADISSLV